MLYNAIREYGNEKMFKLIEDHDLLQHASIINITVRSYRRFVQAESPNLCSHLFCFDIIVQS